MSAHTKGPWGLCYHLKSHENDAACSCGYRGSIWSGDGEAIICEMGSSPDVDDKGRVQGHTMPMRDRASQLADARLIAAAPEMLEALKELVRFFDKTGFTTDFLKPARAVVAKAEGRSS